MLAAAALSGCADEEPAARPQTEATTSPAPRSAAFHGQAGDPVHGTITVTTVAGGYAVRVDATGLVPRRAYALHLHEGRCVGPNTVRTRYELPPLHADANGRGVVQATVSKGPPAGPGTVLHVHGSTVPGTDDYRKVECTPLPG